MIWYVTLLMDYGMMRNTIHVDILTQKVTLKQYHMLSNWRFRAALRTRYNEFDLHAQNDQIRLHIFDYIIAELWGYRTSH